MIKSRLNIVRKAGLRASDIRHASLEVTHDGDEVITIRIEMKAEGNDLPKLIGKLDVALIKLILTGHEFRQAGFLKRIWMAIKWNG